MKKEEFINLVEENIKDVSLENAKKIILKLSDRMSSNLFEIALCIIKDVKGNLEVYDETMRELEREIYNDFEKIKNGEICLMNLSI